MPRKKPAKKRQLLTCYKPNRASKEIPIEQLFASIRAQLKEIMRHK